MGCGSLPAFPARSVHAGPAAPGKYLGFNQSSIWAADRGTYRWSWYYYLRSGAGESYHQGRQPTMTRVEMDLLKAEALIWLRRAAEAVPLINASRVANGELPPVTIDGPPDDGACVPRKTTGGCGSLWDALRYEKRIEMAGVDPTVAYFDARGWQTLVENTYVQFPVPGRELETLLLPLYTYGGGQAGSAPPPDPERCPVPLPRCP